jgi:ferredoxin
MRERPPVVDAKCINVTVGDTQHATATLRHGSRVVACERAGFAVMRIQTDHSKCTGNGLCAGTAPTVFDVSEDGYVEVLQDVPAADLEAVVRRAAINCPTRAIALIDDDQ